MLCICLLSDELMEVQLDGCVGYAMILLALWCCVLRTCHTHLASLFKG